MLSHRLPLTLAASLCLACSPSNRHAPRVPAATEAAQEPSEAEGTHLELRTSSLVELYFHIRAEAADLQAEPAAGHATAVDAARAIQRSLGSFGGWGPLDTQVFVAADARELRQGFAELPEPYVRRGREFSIRDDAVRLAGAIEELVPEFERVDWPSRKVELDDRIAYVDVHFMPEHRKALAFMMESLGIRNPEVTVPMFLVGATNPPGAMTYHLRGGAPVSVLDVNVGGAGDLLLETLLHESSHALDQASRDDGSAFDTLRRLLEERGVSRDDDAYHTVPHTLMFVQAEETMRRLYDPEHLAYGDATDLYARSGAAAVVEREIWPRFLDGELTRDEALLRIVDRLEPPD